MKRGDYLNIKGWSWMKPSIIFYNRPPSTFKTHDRLAWYKKSKESYDWFPWKTGNRRTAGNERQWIYRTNLQSRWVQIYTHIYRCCSDNTSHMRTWGQYIFLPPPPSPGAEKLMGGVSGHTCICFLFERTTIFYTKLWPKTPKYDFLPRKATFWLKK